MICNLAENLEDLMGIVGYEKFEEVIKTFGGESIYIPTYSSITKLDRNKAIKRRYNGGNARQLANEYLVSPRHIKRIAKDNYK